jgi:pimeloyl-ACP methyl ester carboxylesterase
MIAHAALFATLRRSLAAVLIALPLSACVTGGNPRAPIPVVRVAAAEPTRRVVVFLPGRGDRLETLVDHQVAERIQAAWPGTDVVLTGLTMPYYKDGHVVEKLHDEIIAPELARHPGGVWIAGISLGGMGALFYEHDHPGAIRGFVLFSPYLGDAGDWRDVDAAGGLAAWDPGAPASISQSTYRHELLRTLHAWAGDATRAQSVWIAYGTDEDFRATIERLTPSLPASHVLALPGSHAWSLWDGAIDALFARVAADADVAP